MIKASAVEFLTKAKYWTQLYCKVITNYRHFLENWDRGEGVGVPYFQVVSQRQNEHF